MPRHAFIVTFYGVVALQLIAGCGEVCEPGETRQCPCLQSESGVQVCSGSGDAWEECECLQTGSGSNVTATPSTWTVSASSASGESSDDEVGDPTDDGSVCANWRGSGFNGQIAPGCTLTTWYLFFADRLSHFWGTQPSYLCEAAEATSSCHGSLTQGYWFDPIDSAVLLLHEGTAAYENIVPYGSAIIFAHEWGHVNQNALHQFQGCASMLPTAYMELSADCYAGLFSGAYENGSHGELFSAGVRIFSLEANPYYCSFPDPAHGTCAQRSCVFGTAYELAGMNYDQLCAAPIDVASEYCPTIVDECLGA